MNKRTIQLLVITTVAFAAVVFVHTLLTATVYGPTDGEVASAADEATSTSLVPGYASVPVRLRIPSVGVDARVQHVGLTPSGAMGIPTNFTDVAWYSKGVIPGNRGTAYIDGHVDNGLALAGVFKRLSDVKLGDLIYIDGRNGSTTQFIVTNIARYEYDAPETKAIFENDMSGSYVKLITCGGVWVQSKRTYDHRLVVTARMVKTG